jgi:hypothetical protein
MAMRYRDDMFYCQECDKCYNASNFKSNHPDHAVIPPRYNFYRDCYYAGI